MKHKILKVHLMFQERFEELKKNPQVCLDSDRMYFCSFIILILIQFSLSLYLLQYSFRLIQIS